MRSRKYTCLPLVEVSLSFSSLFELVPRSSINYGQCLARQKFLCNSFHDPELGRKRSKNIHGRSVEAIFKEVKRRDAIKRGDSRDGKRIPVFIKFAEARERGSRAARKNLKHLQRS